MPTATPPKTKASSRTLVIMTVVIIAVFGGLFLIEFIKASQKNAIPEETLTAASYMDVVAPLLENADAARGEALIQKFECHSCHIEGADRIAPGFVGIGERAKTQRPPLQAAAYLYESIVNPHAFFVNKPLESDASAEATPQAYPPVMPINYTERLTKEELGDIIAYLLAQ